MHMCIYIDVYAQIGKYCAESVFIVSVYIVQVLCTQYEQTYSPSSFL